MVPSVVRGRVPAERATVPSRTRGRHPGSAVIRYPGTWSVPCSVAKNVLVVTDLLGNPERVRRVARAVVALIIGVVVATVDGGMTLPPGWVWLVLPAGLGATALPPRHRAWIFALCAGFVV